MHTKRKRGRGGGGGGGSLQRAQHGTMANSGFIKSPSSPAAGIISIPGTCQQMWADVPKEEKSATHGMHCSGANLVVVTVRHQADITACCQIVSQGQAGAGQKANFTLPAAAKHPVFIP